MLDKAFFGISELEISDELLKDDSKDRKSAGNDLFWFSSGNN